MSARRLPHAEPMQHRHLPLLRRRGTFLSCVGLLLCRSLLAACAPRQRGGPMLAQAVAAGDAQARLAVVAMTFT